jgi:hypothetical protein
MFFLGRRLHNIFRVLVVLVLVVAQVLPSSTPPTTDLPRVRGSRQGGVAVGVAFEFIKYL